MLKRGLSVGIALATALGMLALPAVLKERR